MQNTVEEIEYRSSLQYRILPDTASSKYPTLNSMHRATISLNAFSLEYCIEKSWPAAMVLLS